MITRSAMATPIHRVMPLLALGSWLFGTALPQALAQDRAVQQHAAPATGPAREGNIYGGTDHQPTEAEVGPAEGPGGVDYPSAANRDQVEKSVDELLRQTDELDKASEDIERGYLPSPGPASGGTERK